MNKQWDIRGDKKEIISTDIAAIKTIINLLKQGLFS